MPGLRVSASSPSSRRLRRWPTLWATNEFDVAVLDISKRVGEVFMQGLDTLLYLPTLRFGTLLVPFKYPPLVHERDQPFYRLLVLSGLSGRVDSVAHCLAVGGQLDVVICTVYMAHLRGRHE